MNFLLVIKDSFDCEFLYILIEFLVNCVYGDMQEKFFFLEKMCVQIVVEMLFLCYKNFYDYKCCDFCEKVVDKLNLGKRLQRVDQLCKLI